jgi:uncharacterized protein YacL
VTDRQHDITTHATAGAAANQGVAATQRHGAPSLDQSARFGTNMATALFVILGGVLAYLGGLLLSDRGTLPSGPNNLFYLTIVGMLIAYLVTRAPARRAGRLWSRAVRRVTGVGPDVVVAGGAGATVGLLLTILVNTVLAEVPGFTWYWSILIAVVMVVGWSGFLVMNRKIIPVLRSTASREASLHVEHAVRDKVVDTSAIIDGRIVDVAQANFLDGKLMLPKVVLAELQRLADSEDPLRRQRGRRGLEVLDSLAANPQVRTEVVEFGESLKVPVDDKLVRLCIERNYDLITTDYNLSRVAGLQGVRVLNVNQLANSVKATYMPGERLSLNIVKPGREAGQGLAYLEDGTMVVVEEAGDMVGMTLDVVVTSSLQTNMGRMIFARSNGDKARA